MPQRRRPQRLSPLESYLHDVGEITRSQAGTPETSLYGPLEALLTRTGMALPTPVRTIMQLRNDGAGMPDGGFFDVKQMSATRGLPEATTSANGRIFSGQPPTHGVIEAKPIEADLAELARSTQVRKYLNRYGRILITNYRQFMIVDLGSDGSASRGETFTIADSPAAFHARCRAVDVSAEEESRFAEYLARALSAGAPIRTPQELAWVLASYARIALARVESGDLAALDALKASLSDSLGLTFEDDEGEHFFRSTLVQTLFYGVFSSWVLWQVQNPAPDARYSWRQASWSLDVPMVRALFDQIATPSNLAPLDLDEVLDWAGEALDRVDRGGFFGSFEADHAVQYFYEPFLASFDPDLRKQLGVWYTPPEVVRYMVGRVDRVLQDDLGIDGGLANERVWVLDPCTGTGSFLVEVLRRIHERLERQTGDALVAADLKAAATRRVVGFELLPAPFVVAHLQIGLLLARLGAPLRTRQERAAVYLTNALTGWQEDPAQTAITFPDLLAERDAAQKVKRDDPILVVIGNPPYNAFAGVSPEEDGGLLEAYKEGLAKWGVTKHSLDDLYVRFLRVATRRIAASEQGGVVCFISNSSYVADPSHVIVRQRLLDEFDAISIDNLNGDSRATGKKTPWGAPDPSVFPQQIRVGTAVGLFVRQPADRHQAPASVRYRDFWGRTKRDDLVASLASLMPEYEDINPVDDLALAFKPQRVHAAYGSWARLDEWCALPPLLGLNENRKGALIAYSSDELSARMHPYFDPEIATEDLPDDLDGVSSAAARFKPERVREELLEQGWDSAKVLPFLVKPFDQRWAYVESSTKLWNEARPELVDLHATEIEFLLARRRAFGEGDLGSLLVVGSLFDQHALHKDAYAIPMNLPLGHDVTGSATRRKAQRSTARVSEPTLFGDGDEGLLLSESPEGNKLATGLKANLSTRARSYLRDLGISDIDGVDSKILWLHAVAIGFAPAYRAQNEDAGRFGYPRIPLPATATVLHDSAKLGALVERHLNVSEPCEPQASDVSAFWNRLASTQARRVGGVTPVAALDLTLTGWAVIQPAGVFPKDGDTIVRPVNDDELAGRIELADALGLSSDHLNALLGQDVVDVVLNEHVLWSGVPACAWNTKVGGFAVLRKWLSYRDHQVLGRAMTVAEVRQFTDIVRRIVGLHLLGPSLDRSYTSILDDIYTW